MSSPTDPFTPLLGNYRGARSDGSSLLVISDAAGRRELDRLIAELRAGQFADTLAALHAERRGLDAPLPARLLAALTAALAEVAAERDDLRVADERAMEFLGLRVGRARHLVGNADAAMHIWPAGGESHARDCARRRSPGNITDVAQAVCGRELGGGFRLLRGCWQRHPHLYDVEMLPCLNCRSVEHEYAECAECPPLGRVDGVSEQQLATGAQARLKDQLAAALPAAPRPLSVAALAQLSERSWTDSVDAHAAQHAAGEEDALVRLLGGDIYDQVGRARAGRWPRRRPMLLADAVSAEDWRAALQHTRQSGTYTPDYPWRAGVGAVRARLLERGERWAAAWPSSDPDRIFADYV